MSNGLRVVFFTCAVILIGISALGFEKSSPYEDLFEFKISSIE